MPIQIVRKLCVLTLVVGLASSAGLAVAAASVDARPRAKRHVVVRGVSVRDVQRALGVDADGIWGPLTDRSLRRFQRRHGLEVDGIVGPVTARALGVVADVPALRGTLSAIAACESGGDPHAVSRDGRYRGKYQFTRATWRALGGSGDPARASEAEQDRRAALLHRRTRGGAWPNCP